MSHNTWTSQELGITGQREWSFSEILHECSQGSMKAVTNPYYKVQI